MSVATRQDIRNLLATKYFLCIPTPVVDWLGENKIRGIALHAYLYHWHSAITGSSDVMRSKWRDVDLARVLHCSVRTVERLNASLTRKGMLTKVCHAAGVDHLVTIDAAMVEHWMRTAPDRGKPRQTPASAPSAPSAAPPEADPPPVETSLNAATREAEIKAPEPVCTTQDKAPRKDHAKTERKRAALQGKLQKFEETRKELEAQINRDAKEQGIAPSLHPVLSQMLAAQDNINAVQSALARIDMTEQAASRAVAYGTASTTSAPAGPVRKLKKADLDSLRSAARKAGVSSPKELFTQLVWALTCGKMSNPEKWPASRAIGVASALVRSNRWRTPWDMPANWHPTTLSA